MTQCGMMVALPAPLMWQGLVDLQVMSLEDAALCALSQGNVLACSTMWVRAVCCWRFAMGWAVVVWLGQHCDAQQHFGPPTSCELKPWI